MQQRKAEDRWQRESAKELRSRAERELIEHTRGQLELLIHELIRNPERPIGELYWAQSRRPGPASARPSRILEPSPHRVVDEISHRPAWRECDFAGSHCGFELAGAGLTFTLSTSG